MTAVHVHRFVVLVWLAGIMVSCGAEPLPSKDCWVRAQVRIVLDGAPPPLPIIEVDKSADHCGETLEDPVLVVGPNGGVLDCVISLEPVGMALEFDPEVSVLSINAKHCLLQPRVQCAQLGSSLQLQNTDAIAHNPHLWDPKSRTAANVTLFNDKVRRRVGLTESGVWRLDCDIHDWMKAYIHVFDHPLYARTASDGLATIQVLCPPGRYRVRVWHEVLGVQVEEISISDGTAHLVRLPLADHRSKHLLPHGMREWPKK